MIYKEVCDQVGCSERKMSQAGKESVVSGHKRKWWKEAVIYQIFPRTFRDGNDDGIGDLRGIINSLDYLKDLGVDAVWLCPVYASPNFDAGYDISDYTAVSPDFGTMEDLDELVAELHKRDMKIIMDLVLNHTSHEHKWFLESRKSKDNAFRDYYYWRPGRNGEEPNNWASLFQGSAWEYDETTGEYYFHFFTPQQPDLNWGNPELREEMIKMMEYWCEKKIDGFRMDDVNALSKDTSFEDVEVTNPHIKYQDAEHKLVNGPHLMEYLSILRDRIFSKYDLFTVGETPKMTPDICVRYTAEESGFFDTLFHFELMDIDLIPDGPFKKWVDIPWKMEEFKKVATRWQTGLEKGKAWNTLYLENHDQPRSVSRFGNTSTPELHKASAKALATWMLMMKGTPFIYQGQEIGMVNAEYQSIDDIQDLETILTYKNQLGKRPHEELWAGIIKKCRDNGRSIMQWSDGTNAGFNGGAHTSLRLNKNYKTVNVKAEQQDPDSILNYYKKLIKTRKAQDVLLYGPYNLILEEHDEIYAFLRDLDNEHAVVLVNLKNGTPQCVLPQDVRQILNAARKAELLITNYDNTSAGDPTSILAEEGFQMKPYEARVYKFII